MNSYVTYSILLALFFMAVFAVVSAISFYESHIEKVEFNQRNGHLWLERYRILSIFSKQTALSLEHIVRVHAAKIGYVGKDND